MKLWLTATALLAFGAAVSPRASALPVLIDFTDAAWAGVNGQSSLTRSYGATDVTLSATAPMTFNAHEAPESHSAPLALDGDGIGVRNDEISLGQRIDVLFDSAVTVLGYYFLDLFDGEGPDGGGEIASVLFDSASFVDVGTATDDVGYYGRDVSETTTALSFLAGPLAAENGNYAFSDFALAGILIETESETFPEQPVKVQSPSTLALVALGLLAGGVRRRASTRG